MKQKICENCGKRINIKVESYFQVDTYEKGKKVLEGYLHKACSDDLTEEREIFNKKVLPLVDRVNSMIDSLGLPEQPRVYEIGAKQ